MIADRRRWWPLWMHGALRRGVGDAPLFEAVVVSTICREVVCVPGGLWTMKIALVAAVALVVSAACASGNVFELKVGQCFDDPENMDVVSDVELIDCDKPHDNEVYALFDMPEGDFPGVSAVETAALDGCYDAFEPYVGIDYASSALDFNWLSPTSDSWENGDQEIICIAYDLDLKKLTDTVKDSRA
jgi:putative regulator of septum formation